MRYAAMRRRLKRRIGPSPEPRVPAVTPDEIVALNDRERRFQFYIFRTTAGDSVRLFIDGKEAE